MTTTGWSSAVSRPRFFVLALSIAVGHVARAQSTIPTPAVAPTTPAECARIAATWHRSQVQAASAGIRTVSPDKLDDAIKAFEARNAVIESAVHAWMRECAKKFDLDSVTSAPRLRELLMLDMTVPDTIDFWQVARRALAAKDLTPRLRAEILVHESDMSLTYRADTAIGMDRAERILRDIDALPDSLADQKLHPNAAIVAVYTSLGLTAAAGAHARTLLSLAQRFGDQRTRRLAYESLARATADRLHADSAVELMRASEHDGGADDLVALARRRYELVGKKGAPVLGQWWLNSPGTSAPIQPGDGKVHLLEFTSFFCTHCRRTYPALRAIADRMKGRDFDVSLVTEIYGFSASHIPDSIDDEIAADRAYFAREAPFRVAIARRGSAAPSPAFVAYEVGHERPILANVPQIVVLDRRGIIRAIVGGFEEGGEERISNLIERLLAEKR